MEVSVMDSLAVNGGTPVRKEPINSTGERFGDREIELLTEVIRSQQLNVNTGTRAKEFAQRFADYMQMKHGVMVTSGTAAIHVALGALHLNPGDEVITSPITDMGTIVPILLQNAVPVFADLDPNTLCLDPADIEQRITPRTRVIMPVHLAGNASDMTRILQIASRHKLMVVEDCAQSFNAKHQGDKVGTFGHLSCFSLNQFKHISCGDGGVTLTKDSDLARQAELFADKAWPRDQSGRNYLFLAPNYRVTELQAAVALAQLEKLDSITDTRRRLGDLLTIRIADLPGLHPMRVADGDECTYWFY